MKQPSGSLQNRLTMLGLGLGYGKVKTLLPKEVERDCRPSLVFEQCIKCMLSYSILNSINTYKQLSETKLRCLNKE